MSVIPCEQNKQLRKKIKDFAETLKTESHTLGDHGLDESEFYNSGLFRGAIERIRGQFSATMREKREFVSHILNYMQDQGLSRNGNQRERRTVTIMQCNSIQAERRLLNSRAVLTATTPISLKDHHTHTSLLSGVYALIRVLIRVTMLGLGFTRG